jgi:hypothetical protein
MHVLAISIAYGHSSGRVPQSGLPSRRPFAVELGQA